MNIRCARCGAEFNFGAGHGQRLNRNCPEVYGKNTFDLGDCVHPEKGPIAPTWRAMFINTVVSVLVTYLLMRRLHGQ